MSQPREIETALWDLIDKWRESMNQPAGPYLSEDPKTAYGQAMNEAAEDLSDLILDFEDRLNTAAKRTAP